LTETVLEYNLYFMKVIKIILLIVLVAAFFPSGAFCNDPHDVSEDGHCAIVGHGLCSHVVVTGNSASIFLPHPISSTLSAMQFFYQNPLLYTFRRPPVVSA